jgi:hypothetical protein
MRLCRCNNSLTMWSNSHFSAAVHESGCGTLLPFDRIVDARGIAEPNTVVIAEGTRRLPGDRFELQDLGTKDLKGIAGLARAWAAAGLFRQPERQLDVRGVSRASQQVDGGSGSENLRFEIVGIGEGDSNADAIARGKAVRRRQQGEN